MAGKVIGINTAIVAQGQGIGFAIPVNMAKSILDDLKTKGKVTRGWLGVSIQNISDEIAKSMNYKNKNGVLVSDVFKDDPADKAGIKVGDIITHELLLITAALRVGEKANIKVVRDGKEIYFQIIVAERKDKPEIALAQKSGSYFGISVQEITKEMAKQLGFSVSGGVIVNDVEEGSPADNVGIQQNDIILQVNKIKIMSLKQYLAEMSKAAEKKSVILLVKRGNANFFVGMNME
jgi:serine protease Do